MPSVPETPPIVRLSRVAKSYDGRTALDGLDLELHRGEWIGLVGPNGAGKTTAMLAVAGLVPIDSGRIEVLGRPIRGPRPRDVGWVPQQIALYGALTGQENLEAFGALHGLRGSVLGDRVEWALEWTGLRNRAGDRVDTYSGGMQRRLNIACAVLHRPRVVLLDEPTVGVDPTARLRIFEMLEALRRDGSALLHSSHELDDIETTCKTLYVIDRGRAIAAGPVHKLVQKFAGAAAAVTLELPSLPGDIGGLERRPDGRWTARLEDVAGELPSLLAAVREAGAEIHSVDLHRPGLREVFLHLTGTDLRE